MKRAFLVLMTCWSSMLHISLGHSQTFDDRLPASSESLQVDSGSVDASVANPDVYSTITEASGSSRLLLANTLLAMGDTNMAILMGERSETQFTMKWCQDAIGKHCLSPNKPMPTGLTGRNDMKCICAPKECSKFGDMVASAGGVGGNVIVSNPTTSGGNVAFGEHIAMRDDNTPIYEGGLSCHTALLAQMKGSEMSEETKLAIAAFVVLTLFVIIMRAFLHEECAVVVTAFILWLMGKTDKGALKAAGTAQTLCGVIIALVPK